MLSSWAWSSRTRNSRRYNTDVCFADLTNPQTWNRGWPTIAFLWQLWGFRDYTCPVPPGSIASFTRIPFTSSRPLVIVGITLAARIAQCRLKHGETRLILSLLQHCGSPQLPTEGNCGPPAVLFAEGVLEGVSSTSHVGPILAAAPILLVHGANGTCSNCF